MKEHILIVDDEEIVRTGLAEDLQRDGFRVTTAASGEEALRCLGAQGADLVLCDLVMEGMDGMHLLRNARTTHPDLPVIMMTGYGSMNTAIEALRLGASDYIQKPAGPEEIIHRVRTVLDAVRLRRTMLAERQKAEERKREFYDRLVRAERMMSLGVLADGVAYELNNILGPVVSYPDVILEKLPADSPLRSLVGEIGDSGAKAAAVLRDLQAIGRGSQISNEPMSLNRVVQDYLASRDFEQVKAGYHGVAVETHLADGLPVIAGSASQVTRVLANLLLNALEAMPHGGRLNISTTAEHIEHPIGRYETAEAGHYVLLTVQDTGIGMHADDLEHIFEPFYTHKRWQKKRMSGLGLTVVYRVVKDHNGYIDVRSQEGKGSTFILYFPAVQAQAEVPEETLLDFGGTETVLVVDDYEEQRKVAASLLEVLGYKVLMVESGRAAVKVFEDRKTERGAPDIDLIVLDMILADDFDGLETYKKIIEIVPGQKAVIVSGFAETDRIVQARKLGVGRYVQKPYSLEALGRAVREELDEER
ncbi:MAG: response regulator [Kiritimatiellae bacterium]|nr:response regulator [Kiritimatiellia bacterium]